MSMRTWMGWLVLGILLPAAAAAQTGTITGTVTRIDTGSGVSTTVYVVRNGVYTTGTSDASGAYTIAGLAPGTYRAFTNVNGLFLNEIFANVACVGFCFDEVNGGAGSLITVTSGGTTAGIDFSLALSGRISGTVVDANGAVPLSGAFVIVASADGQSVASGQTNGMGEYTVSYGMPTGTYYAFTTNGSGFLNEIYDDVVCPSFCDSSDAVATGTPIAVTVGATTAGIGFALTRGATIAGRVTNASTALGVDGVQIWIFDEQGESVGATSTNGSGDYLTAGLVAGTYFLVTNNDLGFINEIYDDVACVGQCVAATSGTPIVLASSQARTGVDFALAVGGRIAGTVTAASGGAPLPGIDVRVVSATGIEAGSASSDGNGEYLTTTGLATGTYYLVTQNFDGYLDEIYDGQPCLDCDAFAVVTRGTPVAVTAGATVSGRNFQLARGGTISGRVVSAVGGAAVTGVEVRAASREGGFGQATTDASGHYTIDGLPAGQYVAWTIYAAGVAPGFVNEIYPDLPCLGFCDDTLVGFLGQPIALASEGAVANIDFALAPGGSVSGSVTDADSGGPLANVTVQVATVQDGAFVVAGSTQTTTAGLFTVAGVPPGTYVAFTRNSQGYIDEMSGGLPCLGECQSIALIGSPFTVTGAAPAGGLAFALAKGGRIAGTVSDAGSGGPVRNAQVVVFDRSGTAVAFAQSVVDGSYLTSTGLLPGTYYVAVSPPVPFLGRAFGGTCLGPCDGAQAVALGSPVTVAGSGTTAAIDLPLARGGLVRGTLSEQGTGIVLPFENVYVVDAQGRRAASAFGNGTGEYELDEALPTGTFFAYTDTDDHVDEVFDNRPCGGECTASRAPGGTAIHVTAGATTGGRHFALARRSGVPGPPSRPRFSLTPGGLVIEWSSPTTGGQPDGYAVDVGLTPGATALTLPATGTAYVVPGRPPGRFYVRVRAANASGAGPPSEEAVLALGGGAMLPDQPRFARAWMHGARLFMQWERHQFGGAASHYLVEAGTAPGLTNIGTIPVNAPAFTYDGVPPGTYFLRVRAASAAGVSGPSNEVMVVAGGAPAPPGAPYAVGAAVSGSTVSLTWSKPAGSVTGYVLEAGTAVGLSNAAVITLGPQTSIAFPGIPPGRYFVRVRAVNALGAGPVSEEMTVVVQ